MSLPTVNNFFVTLFTGPRTVKVSGPFYLSSSQRSWLTLQRIKTITKINISPLQAGYRSSNALNANLEEIKDAIDNTLSRDGTGPNQMEAILDMNSNRIINLSAPEDDNDPVRLIDVTDGTVTGVDEVARADATEALEAVATKANQDDLDALVVALDDKAPQSALDSLTTTVSAKADSATVTAGLALKADTTALTSGLALKADATALTTGLGLKAALAGDTFTGPVAAPFSWSTQANTQNVTNDYGQIVRADVPLVFAQGTASTPITTDSYIRPMVYFERHVAGRQSQPISTSLNDAHLDSNWLLSPSFMIQTVMGPTGSNANAGIHSRVISTGIGTNPTATNPGQLSQADLNRSTNCLCAYVGTVHTNGSGGGQARPVWVINSELRWETGTAPENMVGMEIDIINSGGAATSHLPSSQNNFTGIWAQSAARNGTSTSNHRAATTAFYVSSDVAYTGWMSAMTARASLYNYGLYVENLLTGATATGLGVFGTSWNYGVNVDTSCFLYGVRVNNTRNAANAGGLEVGIARAADDAIAFSLNTGSGTALYVTGDATDPIRMRINGSVRRISTRTLGSLVSGNEVLICI